MNQRQRVLVVDDEPFNCKLLVRALQNDYTVDIATSGSEALQIASSDMSPDLILLDIMMPGMDGYEVCQQLRSDQKTEKIPIIFVSALDDLKDELKGLGLGAVDYISKPFKLPILRNRVKNHLELKQYQDSLSQKVEEKTEEVRKSFIESIYRLTLAAEYKDEETGDHIKRVSYYTKEIAAQLGMPSEFCETIFYASPMHDIGKVGIPDSILLKNGSLTAQEWETMKSHTTIGGKILEDSGSPYLQMAMDIALYHHERWCGGGYPFDVQGDKIPLAARIMNIADQYDALRSKRPYKPGFSHEKTFEILTKGDGRTSPDHFDPQILEAFQKGVTKFNEIYESVI